MLSVYIVDSNKTDRADLIRAIEHRNYQVRTFDTAAAFIAICDDLPAGVAIIDLCLPDLDGLALQQAVNNDCETDLPIIFLSGLCDVSDAVTAMREGAIDFFRKPFRRVELLKALDRAERVLEEHRKRLALSETMDPVVANLTRRELDVIRASRHGQSSKQVAYELGLSTRTVEMHRSHIIKKLNVPNFAAALLFAVPTIVESN